MIYVKKIIDFLYPVKCVFCYKEQDFYICNKCKNKLVNEVKELKLNNNSILYYIGSYKDLSNYINLFKYASLKLLAYEFGRILGKYIFYSRKKYDFIIYVPMYYKKEKYRGYNQSKEIAKGISDILSYRLLDILIKVKETKEQNKLSKKERLLNLKDTFFLKDIKYIDLKNKKILLVDDVYTTGTTTNRIINLLKNYKGIKIDIAVVAYSK